MAMNFSDAGIVFNDGSVQPTALTTGTQTIAGEKTFSSRVIAGAGVQGALVLATAQATTSGTSIDFTGIPSWVKRITVMFNGVSTNGGSFVQVQLGSGSFTTSGYLGGFGQDASPALLTTGFGVGSNAATDVVSGNMTLCLMGSNTWICSAVFARTSSASMRFSAGNVTLGGTLDRLRLTTVNGTDTFDAGSVNIMYEG